MNPIQLTGAALVSALVCVPGRFANAESPQGHRPQQRSLEAQRRREETELQRQLDRAAHLRQVNQQTGNSQLIDIADRMEKRAVERYQQQLDLINGLESRAQQSATLATEQDAPIDSPLVSILKSRPTAAPSPQPADISPLPTNVFPQPTVTNAPPSAATHPPQPTGPPPLQPTLAPTPQPTLATPPRPTRAHPLRISDQVQRQLVSEQKVLRQRLDAADRLRQLNEGPNGNKHLLETADKMEQRAWEQFEQRVQRLLDPPRNLQQHYRQRYVVADTPKSESTTDQRQRDVRSRDQRQRDIETVEYRVVPAQRPVRRVLRGLRNALGR